MEEEVDIKDLLIALWRKRIMIIAVTLVFLLIGVLLYGRTNMSSKNKKTIISAKNDTEEIDMCYVETDFIFSRGTYKELDGVNSTYKLTIDAGVITNLNKFATSTTFLERVLSEIPLAQEIAVDDMKENIKVLGNGDVMILIVANQNEEVAVRVSDAILLEITSRIHTLYMIEELMVIDGPRILEEEEIKELDDKINSKTVVTENAQVGDASSETAAKSSPKKKIILVTAVGFVLACGVVIVMELLDSSVKNEKQLEMATNAKILARIPNSDSDVSEYFKILRVNVENYQTLLITSPGKGDGKSFVALNLAKSFANFGKKTLLIDIPSLLQESMEKKMQESDTKNLTMVVSKEDAKTSTEVKDSVLAEKIKKLASNYEMIIIDAASILEDANSLTVAKMVKNIILVSAERKTKLEKIIRAKNHIENISGNLIGNVLNKSTTK